MMPYAYEKLAEQQATIEKEGEEAWLARNLRETVPPAPDVHAVALAAS